MSVIFWVLIFLPAAAAQPGTNKYYSSAGTYQSNCQVSSCASCPPGQYRARCGNDGSGNAAYYGSPGECVPCSLTLPANAQYDPNQVGYLYADSCVYVCNSGYYNTGSACILSTCTPPTDPNAAVSGNVPSCVYTCNAGYLSVANQVASSTCAICPAGTYSSASDLACTPCAANYYASAAGRSACTLCPLPTASGMYLSGCGGSSAGALAQCTLP